MRITEVPDTESRGAPASPADAPPEALPIPWGSDEREGGKRPERRRLAIALLLSLLVHLPLLALTFGGDGTGLPGLGFPWQVRRVEAPDLRVLLLPGRPAETEPAVAPVTAPLRLPRVEKFATTELPPSPPAPSPESRKPAALAVVAQDDAKRESAAVESPPKAPSPTERPDDASPAPEPEPAVIAVERSDEAAPRVPVTPPPAPVVAEAPSIAIPEKEKPPMADAEEAARARIDQEARERALEQEKLERARQEERRRAEQLAAARQEAARQEAARQEAARQEWARQEAARQEAARQEAARQELARQETARQEAARQEAARQEAARQEAARQEAARKETARQEALRQEAARQEAARLEAAKDEARRDAVRRALGRQLDEEAAKRAAASPGERLPLSVGSARRARLFGRVDPNAELARYGEDWARKIQMNMTFEMVREAAKSPHTPPTVTVAVRRDGSVESVTFVVSSGVPDLDEAIRRVVQSQERYPAFPPALALEYDVIEIRRTWHFDMAIRLH